MKKFQLSFKVNQQKVFEKVFNNHLQITTTETDLKRNVHSKHLHPFRIFDIF